MIDYACKNLIDYFYVHLMFNFYNLGKIDSAENSHTIVS